MTRNGPRDGIYLDAALAVAAQEVEERIDRIEARRRRRARLGVAVLSLSTLAGGSIAAAALVTAPPATVVIEVPIELRDLQCVEGADPTAAAYLTLRYAIPAGAPDPLDAAEVCRSARALLIGDPAAVLSNAPEELLRRATELLAAGLVAEPDETRPAAPAPTVHRASFLPLREGAAGATTETVCLRGADDRRVVVVVPRGPDSGERACDVEGYRAEETR